MPLGRGRGGPPDREHGHQADDGAHDDEERRREHVARLFDEPDGEERGGATGDNDTDVPARRDPGVPGVGVEQLREQRVRADLGADGVEDFCRRLVEEAGVLLLPASIYRSELTETPADRFRIGVGRSHPEPGLEAIAGWLRGRS